MGDLDEALGVGTAVYVKLVDSVVGVGAVVGGGDVGGDIEEGEEIAAGSHAHVEVAAGLPGFIANAGFDAAVAQAHLVGGFLVEGVDEAAPHGKLQLLVAGAVLPFHVERGSSAETADIAHSGQGDGFVFDCGGESVAVAALYVFPHLGHVAGGRGGCGKPDLIRQSGDGD